MTIIQGFMLLLEAWILIMGGIILCEYVFFPSEDLKKKRQINFLTKSKNNYDKNKDEEDSGWDESTSKWIEEKINRIRQHKDITMDDIEIANSVITAINDAIKLYTYETLSTKFFVREKIEVTTLDTTIKYVSDKTFAAFSKNIFEINGVYSPDYFVDYIVKETRVYVTQTVIEYNINLSQQL